jgi:hypothetical protein
VNEPCPTCEWPILTLKTTKSRRPEKVCPQKDCKYAPPYEGDPEDVNGRALDNIFVEGLWRTVKYENFCMNDYQTVIQLRFGLKRYFEFYNHGRLHQSRWILVLNALNAKKTPSSSVNHVTIKFSIPARVTLNVIMPYGMSR